MLRKKQKKNRVWYTGLGTQLVTRDSFPATHNACSAIYRREGK